MKNLILMLAFLTLPVQADVDSDMMWSGNAEFQFSRSIKLTEEPYNNMSIEEILVYYNSNMLWYDDNEFKRYLNVFTPKK